MKNNDMKEASVSSRKRPNYIRTNSNTLQPKFTCSRNLDAVSIGARLSQTRKGLGVTQEEMAKALFISPPAFASLKMVLLGHLVRCLYVCMTYMGLI